MSKSLLAVGASATAVLVLAAVALATNTYTVEKWGTAPAGKGTSARPLAKSLTVKLTGGSHDGTLPAPSTSYHFDLEGIRTYASKFPKCTLGDARTPQHADRCGKARVGGGTAVVKVGRAGMPLGAAKTCPVAIKLYNTGTGLAQRLDSVPGGNCPLNIAAAVPEPWRTTRVEGIRSASLLVEAPLPLIQPGPGLNAFVSEIDLALDKVTRTVTLRQTVRVGGRKRIRRVRRKVGYLSAVGCAGRRRSVVTVILDEAKRTTTVSRTSPC
jgi:hypothetical protein